MLELFNKIFKLFKLLVVSIRDFVKKFKIIKLILEKRVMLRSLFVKFVKNSIYEILICIVILIVVSFGIYLYYRYLYML